jgi:type I restriction enzyme R subunit
MLVANSIYEACRYYTLFSKTELAQRCAVITSYQPNASNITLDDSGQTYSASDAQFVYHTYTTLLQQSGKATTEQYEDWAKQLFIKEPARMKLLIVVDKLLTGFDAPSCTYLYIDKKMQNHGLFQAICRTNRLDGDDKQYGYIVDYKDLFKHVNQALQVYTKPLDDRAPGASPDVTLKERLRIERKNLEDALESLYKQCEPVAPPKDDVAYINYFCGNTEDPMSLEATAQIREILYKSVAKALRCYAAIADQLVEAGCTAPQIARIKHDIQNYVRLREMIQQASGEYIDLKAYEPDMRRLIDTYIAASAPQAISDLDNLSLMQLIAKIGIEEAITRRIEPHTTNKNAIADTMAQNARATITLKSHENPQYYRRMSEMLDEVIQLLRTQAIDYAEYLRRMSELAKKIVYPDDTIAYPVKALYDNLPLDESACRRILEHQAHYNADGDAKLAVAQLIDGVVKQAKQDSWRGNQAKENMIKQAMYNLVKDGTIVEELFVIIKARAEY